MNIALIFAGGVGSRMKSRGIPKQFLQLNGTPVIIHTIEHFEYHPEIDGICVVCVEGWIEHLQKLLRRYDIHKVIGIVPGGATGQESIGNGLEFIRDYVQDKEDREETIVLIHDGVRPLIDSDVITRNIESVKKYGAAITVASAIETIALVDDSKNIVNVEDRSRCYMARAPQSFFLLDILAAHERAKREGIRDSIIDSAMLMTHYGFRLNIVEGPRENIKITTPTDFYIARALIQAREDQQIMGE